MAGGESWGVVVVYVVGTPWKIPFQHTLEDSGSLYQLFLETFHTFLNWECTHARILQTNVNAGAVIWVGAVRNYQLASRLAVSSKGTIQGSFQTFQAMDRQCGHQQATFWIGQWKGYGQILTCEQSGSRAPVKAGFWWGFLGMGTWWDEN